MNKFFTRFAVGIITLFQISVIASAGPLDDYYLQQFGEAKSLQLQKAILSVPPVAQESARCGMPLKHGLKRDWNLLEQSTQKVLAKQLASPVLSGTELVHVSPSGRFKIHYTTTGADAVPNFVWVQAVAGTFDEVAAYYDTTLHWRLAPTPDNSGYDVYLRDLAPDGYYGITTSGQPAPSSGYLNAYTSWMELDNDFTDSIYKPTTYSPLQSLQITAAHEYHHSVQYGYNYYFDIWYAEATSTWMEDERYDAVNQLYSYLSKSMINPNLSLDIPADTYTGGGYGRWLINRHFSESYPGQSIVRQFWESLSTKSSVSGNDIPMTPIIDAVLRMSGSSLSTSFLDYATKLYTKEWTTHQSENVLIPSVTMFATSSIYPITVSSAPTPTVTLPHYSYAFFQMVPDSGAPANLNLTFTRDAGISVIAFRKTSNIITQFTPNPGTNLISIPDFDAASEVVILVANTTGIDNLFVGFSSDSSPIQYSLPGTTIISAAASTTPSSIALSWSVVEGATSYQIYRSSFSSITLSPYATSSTTSYTDTNVIKDHVYFYSVIPVKSAGLIGPASQVSSVKVETVQSVTSSSGSGCFIATAAYGSYLHPQVQLLRTFRDRYLLTNAPGRAFVAWYYRYSPPVADAIARQPVLRGVVRLALAPLFVVVAYPLICAVFLLLAGGILLASRLRRSRDAHVPAFE